MTRSVLLSALFCGAMTLGLTSAAQAENFPTDTIRVSIPFAPGGGTDFLARTVINKMSERTGWPMVVENKPGAAGSIAMNYVSRARPDGHELVLGQTDTMAIAPAIYKNIQWDPVNDFMPIGLMASSPLLVVSGADSPYATLPEAIDVARENPAQIDYASPGVGSVSHLAVAMVEHAAGVELQHIPYKGAGPAMTDLLGGRVALYTASVAAAIPQIQSGNVRPLAVTGSERNHVLPDTPTIVELGYPDIEIDLWYGLFAPAGVDPQRIEKLHNALNETLSDPDVVKILSEQGMTVNPSSREYLASLVEQDVARWPAIVEQAGVTN